MAAETNAASEQLLLETCRDDGVALIEFNRPSKRNAFSQAMIDQLVATLLRLDQDGRVRAVVVTGSPGGPFSGRWQTAASWSAKNACPVLRVGSGRGPQGAGADFRGRGSRSEVPPRPHRCLHSLQQAGGRSSRGLCGGSPGRNKQERRLTWGACSWAVGSRLRCW